MRKLSPQFVRTVIARSQDFLRDGLFLLGVAFLVFGIAAIYRPAGFITLGLLLMAVAFATAKP